MNKTLFVLTLILGATLFIGNASFAQETDDNGQPSITPASDRSIQVGSSQSGRPSLTTLFASNNGHSGNTFDIIPNTPIEISGIDVNSSTTAGGAVTADVWYKAGTCVGYENDPGAWTLLDTGTGTSAGTDSPTYIGLPGAAGVVFDAGQTYGLYVDLGSNCRYTNGGPNTYSNPDLSLITNSGHGPAFTYNFHPRIWNGTIYYDLGYAPPLPDIKVNGSDGPLTLPFGTVVGSTVALDPKDGIGDPADWWIWITLAYSTYWRTSNGWFASATPIRAHGGPLFLLPATPIMSGITPPVGNYVFNFAVDDNMDNIMDATYSDSVYLTIM